MSSSLLELELVNTTETSFKNELYCLYKVKLVINKGIFLKQTKEIIILFRALILQIKSLLKRELKCVTLTAELRSQNVGVKCIGCIEYWDNLNNTLKNL